MNAIEVEGLSKKYQTDSGEFWALRDVTFSVGTGELVGILGSNGAGKSTLLKILSRITAPTAGRALLRGRVSSLLEIGTGFHPELTGRENVFLNGAILGMRRQEVSRKLEQILDFAGTGEFVDRPVKKYSLGMFLRLAFGVSAHLEFDILLLDEVMAVGDHQFREKCLGESRRLVEQGKTILLVSHDIDVVTRMCSRSLYLAGGQLVDQGPTAEMVERYQRGL